MYFAAIPHILWLLAWSMHPTGSDITSHLDIGQSLVCAATRKFLCFIMIYEMFYVEHKCSHFTEPEGPIWTHSLWLLVSCQDLVGVLTERILRKLTMQQVWGRLRWACSWLVKSRTDFQYGITLVPCDFGPLSQAAMAQGTSIVRNLMVSNLTHVQENADCVTWLQ